MSSVHLVACPRPFAMQRIERELPEGGTIADLCRAIDLDPGPLHARVFIDDRLVLKSEWESAIPKAGQLVTVRAIPTGGGGGKDALRIVAMIGVVVAAAFTAGGALAAGAGLIGGGGAFAGVTGAGFGVGGLGSLAAGAAVGIGGSLAIGALIPPAKPKLQDLSRLNLSPALALTGTSNQLAPYAPIPRVYGRHRIYPPLAAQPYTETLGSEQYLRLLFCCGYGPLSLSELKIGETPIAQFQELELDIRYGYPDDLPIALNADSVVEEALSLPLTVAGGAQQRTSQANARELALDITFPNGLGVLNPDGSVGGRFVAFTVEYRAVGDSTWIGAADAPPVAASVTLDFPGANNELVVTATQPGTRRNTTVLTFTAGEGIAVDVSRDGDDPASAINYVLAVTLVDGVTTAAQLAGALTAATGLQIVATHAPGSDGSGTITLPEGGYSAQLAGGADYTPSVSAAAAAFTPLTIPLRWVVPEVGAQYEVRVTRLTPDSNVATIRELAYWTMLRTIHTSAPVSKPGLCLVAMRIKATNQLSGTLDQFNCIAESILPDWTGSTWVARPTSNPASIYRNILQGSANARPLPDSRLDLTRLAAFHVSCQAQGWSFNAIIDYRSTVFELCRDVLAAGRASLHQQDGRFSVVEDLPQALAKQLITPRNSWGFRGTRIFSELPHALKVRFVNPDKDWQQDERLVYADGYSEANSSRFEALELTGVTDPEQAWKLARYHLAVATLRPETYEVNLDVEHLVCNRGDLVLVQHDVPLFGLITGRVKSVATDSYGRATALTLDEPCVMQAGDRYGVRVRLQDNTYVQREVQNVPGSQTTLTLLSPI